MLFSDLPVIGQFISVTRAKELEKIPRLFSQYIENYCQCGSERMVRVDASGDVSGVCCVDPNCMYKVAHQLADSVQAFGYKGFGVGTAFNVLQNVPLHERKFSSILIRSTPVYGLVDVQYSALVGAKEHIASQRCTRVKFISMLMYPYVGDKVAKALPSGDELYTLVDSMQTVQERSAWLATRGIISPTEQFYAAFYLPDIVAICRCYSKCLISTTGKQISICMTGHMSTSLGSFTKDYYLAVCNASLVEDEIPVTLVSVNSVSNATYVIAGPDAIASNTAKYVAGRRVEERNPGSKVVYTPDEFIATIQSNRKFPNCLIGLNNKQVKISMLGCLSVCGETYSKECYLDLCNAALLKIGINAILVETDAILEADYIVTDENSMPQIPSNYVSSRSTTVKTAGTQVIYTSDDFIAAIQRGGD